jgi:hypothetical protein
MRGSQIALGGELIGQIVNGWQVLRGLLLDESGSMPAPPRWTTPRYTVVYDFDRLSGQRLIDAVDESMKTATNGEGLVGPNPVPGGTLHANAITFTRDAFTDYHTALFEFEQAMRNPKISFQAYQDAGTTLDRATTQLRFAGQMWQDAKPPVN